MPGVPLVSFLPAQKKPFKKGYRCTPYRKFPLRLWSFRDISKESWITLLISVWRCSSVIVKFAITQMLNQSPSYYVIFDRRH